MKWDVLLLCFGRLFDSVDAKNPHNFRFSLLDHQGADKRKGVI
jgi:hypothetical protein